MESMQGPSWITLGLLLLYYASMVNLLRVKRKLHRSYRDRGERFDRYFGQDREMLAADRIQLNTLEHMAAFLAALWLHAFWVSPSSATSAGALYLLSRAAYPLVLGSRLGRDIRPSILWVTFTGYAALAWLIGGLLWELGRG